MTTTITMTCEPFASETRGPYRLTVDVAGIVRVRDSVAGHYTTATDSAPGLSRPPARSLGGNLTAKP